jgi:hypothetical protein
VGAKVGLIFVTAKLFADFFKNIFLLDFKLRRNRFIFRIFADK